MKYKVTTELKTPWWLRLLRFFHIKPKRKEFELLIGYEGFNRGDVLSSGFRQEILILEKYDEK